jgi:hypothetical protein
MLSHGIAAVRHQLVEQNLAVRVSKTHSRGCVDGSE